ncbi:hypothetical protein AHAT_34200 [Agarivorans sp. Toyoura001]|uniref:DUF4174 domain-containing protein n=1 Tax=Agarivorans sp. Toyoura001 TaxID=2283141 RepID=UPI0010EA7D39|nr:DUF4174 domain-containing protein [Agarivorans sp. Toyoura001]GDY27530.1 hypothetical protein AHAT_34200 [Agarivorans sp. Toyoura001]
MKNLLALLMICFSAYSHAYPLEHNYWSHRSVLFFAPQQDQYVEKFEAEELRYRCQIKERDMVVLVVTEDAKAISSGHFDDGGFEYLRNKYQASLKQYTAVLVGKDGREKYRWGAETDWQKIFSIIDAMPMRQREMRDAPSVCSA